jgi:Family of unknown function (DUF5989)
LEKTSIMTKQEESGSLDFTRKAAEKRQGFIEEFWGFLKHNKKWWMLPIIIVVLVMGTLVLLGGSPLAPFIYTLF